jgi:hypothetical protein
VSNADCRSKNDKPFTYNLSYFFTTLAVCYLVANIWVVESCKAKYLEKKVSATCSVAEIFTPLRPLVPAIFRPVDVLQARGNPERAELVIAVYGFAWGSFLILATLMIAIGVLRLRLLSDGEIKATLAWCARLAKENRHNKQKANQAILGSRIITTASAFIFIASYWGVYSFDGWDYFANMVQERNRDLYYITIGLFFFLMLEVFFVSTWLLKKISRNTAPNAGDNA